MTEQKQYTLKELEKLKLIDNQNTIIKQFFGDYKEDTTQTATCVEFRIKDIYKAMIKQISKYESEAPRE